MEHHETVAAPAAADEDRRKPASEPSRETGSAEAAGDGGAAAAGGAAGAGSSGTPARRRRRRGGRGRGGGGGNRSTAAKPEGDAESSQGESSQAESSPAEDGSARSNAGSKGSAGPRRTKAPTADAPSDGDAAGDDGSAAAAGGNGTPKTSSAARRRRRGGRGRGGANRSGGARPSSATAEGEPATDAAAETSESQRDDATPDTSAADRDDAAAETETASTETTSTGGSSRSRSRSRRRRSSGGSTKAAAAADAGTADTGTDEAADAPADAEAAAERSGSRSRRAPRQSQKQVEEQIAAGGPTRGIRTSRSRTGRDGRRRREIVTPPRVTDKLMVITEHGDRDQIAVLEEDLLVQHYVTRQGATSMVGNIYLGRVQNVLPGMEAAFVDVGRGRNGVLYAGEVNYAPEDVEGPAPRIEQILKPGQSVMVQVTKDPMGGKGARLTANISLAGRYLVLAPNQSLSGISRRLSEEARRKLKTILKKLKPDEHGVIVRTAAEGATEEAITADLQRLLRIWDEIQKQAKKRKAPNVLYEEPELTVRVVRDLFTDEEFRELVTDSPRVHEKVLEYVREIAPDLEPKITFHPGPLSAFEQHRVVEQIHKALDRKVWLPSGGYLVIERTEAMTIVDVNTGKAVGKTNLEETVVNTNLEAAREVARQLRLRDIGGIIVVDFIDMLLEKNKKQVEDTMREALAIDKTRSQVFEIGPLGLMQVTRKRVSSGLVESFSETCPTCEGRGIMVHYDVD